MRTLWAEFKANQISIFSWWTFKKEEKHWGWIVFCCLWNFVSGNDEIEDIKRLESCFFEIPPKTRTADPRQVNRWIKEWLAGELFENLPTDGIVVKVASGATKQKLGATSKCPNWAIAIKWLNQKNKRCFV